MGARGSTMKNGARALGSDLELSRGFLPALAPRQPHRNRLAFLGDKALFCLSGQGVLCSASRGSELDPVLHLQAGQAGWWGRGQISVWSGAVALISKTGVFITGNRCTTEPRKSFVSHLDFAVCCLCMFGISVQSYYEVIDLYHCINLKCTAGSLDLHLLWNDGHSRIS